MFHSLVIIYRPIAYLSFPLHLLWSYCQYLCNKIFSTTPEENHASSSCLFFHSCFFSFSFLWKSSNSVCFNSFVTVVYISSVTSLLLWPHRFWITLIFTPASTRRVVNVCLSEWQEKFGSNTEFFFSFRSCLSLQSLIIRRKKYPSSYSQGANLKARLFPDKL